MGEIVNFLINPWMGGVVLVVLFLLLWKLSSKKLKRLMDEADKEREWRETIFRDFFVNEERGGFSIPNLRIENADDFLEIFFEKEFEIKDGFLIFVKKKEKEKGK